MSQFYRILMACVGLLTTVAFADETVVRHHKHLPTPQQEQHARLLKSHGVVSSSNWAPVRPFSEIENTGYVAISGENEYELPNLRVAIAQNLPTNVVLIVYVVDASEVPALQQELGSYLDSNHLKFLTISTSEEGDPLWARDSLPFPVYLTAATGTQPATFGLVDSIYPQDFNPGPVIDQALPLPMVDTNEVFRGGNLLFDLSANCFAEDANEVANLSNPVQFFTQYFACKTVTLLTQEGGIGDIDERIKFLQGNVALTDNAAYQSQLTAKGYTVDMIPTTGNDMETYMNTLIVNGTIWVPQMEIAADSQAVAAYQALGFKAIGVDTKELADDDNGNIHCLTMNYPPGTFVQSSQGPSFVEFAPGKVVPR